MLQNAGLSPSRVPVWIIHEDEIGDKNQLEAIGRRIGLPYVMKHYSVVQGVLFGNLEREEDGPLVDNQIYQLVAHDEWPSVILLIGKKSIPVAQEIKRRSKKFTKIVKVGKPEPFAIGIDLRVPTARYPKIPWCNSVSTILPFHLIDQSQLQSDLAMIEGELSHLAKPLIAVLVGGKTKALEWQIHAAQKLAENVSHYARSRGGSLLLCTSKRTGAEEELMIAKHLSVDHAACYWNSIRGDNKYTAFLAAADEIVVTEDSVSMITEACSTGKPVKIYPLKNSNNRILEFLVNGPIRKIFLFGRSLQLAILVKEGLAQWFDLNSPPRKQSTAAQAAIKSTFSQAENNVLLKIRELIS